MNNKINSLIKQNKNSISKKNETNIHKIKHSISKKNTILDRKKLTQWISYRKNK